MRFVDSNILLYAASRLEELEAKRRVAFDLLHETDSAVSAQVLQEFYVQATRSTRPDRLGEEQAGDLIASFLRFPVQPITVEMVTAAIQTHLKFRISYWDAAIIEAARLLGCSEVLSEDLADGQDYDGVLVRNPFV